ncbi:hypothetical protein DFH09DRAFT_1458566 [Mycena vulgaris]|nr:hypothetical protein DFH09DRAFT_1458566 [Mycena vulgaris]
MHVPMFHANDKLYVDPQSPDVGDVFLDLQDIPVGHERSEIKGGSVKPRLVHAPSLLHLDAVPNIADYLTRSRLSSWIMRTLKADLYSGPISLRQSARSIYEATAYRIPDSSNAAENHSQIMCMSDWDRRIGYRGLGMDKVVHGVAVVVVSVVTNCGEVVPIPRQTQDERPLSIGRWRDPGNPFRAVRGAGITRLARHDKDSGVSGKARGEGGYTTVYRASDATLIIAPPQCPFRASNDKDRGNDSYPEQHFSSAQNGPAYWGPGMGTPTAGSPAHGLHEPDDVCWMHHGSGCGGKRGSSLAGIIHPDGASSKWTIHITLSLPPNPNDVAINLADKQARYLAEIADADNVDECTPHVVRWGPPKLESVVPTVIISIVRAECLGGAGLGSRLIRLYDLQIEVHIGRFIIRGAFTQPAPRTRRRYSHNEIGSVVVVAVCSEAQVCATTVPIIYFVHTYGLHWLLYVVSSSSSQTLSLLDDHTCERRRFYATPLRLYQHVLWSSSRSLTVIAAAA